MIAAHGSQVLRVYADGRTEVIASAFGRYEALAIARLLDSEQGVRELARARADLAADLDELFG